MTERAEVTRIVLPKEETAREAGAAAAGQEGLENAALPVPGILSWMIWDVPHIYQYDSYPTGCESVSAVCALRYSGVDITVDDFIDQYLVKGSLGETKEGGLTGPSLDDAFIGDPRTVHGCGCNAPVIVRAAERILEGTELEARNLTGTGLETLCREYVSRDIPVVLWATIRMQAWTNTITWTDEVKGDTVTFYTRNTVWCSLALTRKITISAIRIRSRRSPDMTGKAWKKLMRSWENRRWRWRRKNSREGDFIL